MAFTILAPAKINLCLKVLRRRPDGFHDILSLLQMIGLYDTLSFREEGSGIRLEGPDKGAPMDRSNLALKAARMLQNEMKKTDRVSRGAVITLSKTIPVSAGLGGGSSDAAATLIGLNRLWSLRLPSFRLMELGGYIGSDVPFFFSGPTAWVAGRGERVKKVAEGVGGFVVLVYSGKPVSTASVYNQMDQIVSGEGNFCRRDDPLPSLHEVLWNPENDLEQVTFGMQPELTHIKNLLGALGGQGVLMSGSGPTIFARFERSDQAHAAARSLRGQGYKGVWVARLLRRVPRGFGSGLDRWRSDVI